MGTPLEEGYGRHPSSFRAGCDPAPHLLIPEPSLGREARVFLRKRKSVLALQRDFGF